MATTLHDAEPAVLNALLTATVGEDQALQALETLHVPPALQGAADRATPAQIAFVLNAALFLNLLQRVPTAAKCVDLARSEGQRIVFDHGALRTISGSTGALPSGHEAFGRFLKPLGYEVGGLYPLPALTMTGRAYVHTDMPADVPQFFVSELHVDQLPPAAQAAAACIFGSSRDPLDEAVFAALGRLEAQGSCSLDDGAIILRGALSAFDRCHAEPALADYETLLEHSREGAWIATEGNAFNHATTRVAHVEALAETLKSKGFPMKPTVEISRNGRVRQTAIIADQVERRFRTEDGETIARRVPGSFYEFISRDVDPETGLLDLTFDSGNATGIFAVTRQQA